jgi:hypothetical protein
LEIGFIITFWKRGLLGGKFNGAIDEATAKEYNKEATNDHQHIIPTIQLCAIWTVVPG